MYHKLLIALRTRQCELNITDDYVASNMGMTLFEFQESLKHVKDFNYINTYAYIVRCDINFYLTCKNKNTTLSGIFKKWFGLRTPKGEAGNTPIMPLKD